MSVASFVAAQRTDFGMPRALSCRALGVKANSTWKVTAERHQPGVAIRVLRRLLALTAAIWHNDPTVQPTLRLLTAYDH
jgi:hypothetical protein